MLLVQTNPALAAPIEAEWRSHFADGFARLRRTPSGEVRRACDLLLDDSEPWDMEFTLRLSRGETSADERLAFFGATRQQKRFCSLDVNPVDQLRVAISLLIGHADDAALRAHLADELAAMGEATLPRAITLRKALFPLLKGRFGGSPTSAGGGEYTMALLGGTVPLELCLDFGGRTRGVRWGIGVPPQLEGRRYPFHSSYEALLGLYSSNWDLLRTDRIEVDMALLVERIEAVSRLLWSVRWEISVCIA